MKKTRTKTPITHSDTPQYLKTDLHTHILPYVDDGASDMDMALKLLRMQSERGVERVLLTPHYYPLRQPVEEFLEERQESFEKLVSCCDGADLPQLMVGAEIRFSLQLLEMDLRKLTIGNSNYLLLELPDVSTVPMLDRAVDEIISQNYIPIFAHIERCAIFRTNPELLLKLIEMGSLAQISVGALCTTKSGFGLACLRHNLAHIICSDVHKPTDLANISDLKKYAATFERSDAFAKAIWDDTPLPTFTATPLKTGLFGYR